MSLTCIDTFAVDFWVVLGLLKEKMCEKRDFVFSLECLNLLETEASGHCD